MPRRLLALVVALLAAQPSVGWAVQVAGLIRSAHCTDEVCFCKAARHCPPRKAAAGSCHEAAAPRTLISGACNHGGDVAPLTAVRVDVAPGAPVLAAPPMTGGTSVPVAAAALAGHLEIHSPPPRPALS
jgi:hypothetical protein